MKKILYFLFSFTIFFSGGLNSYAEKLLVLSGQYEERGSFIKCKELKKEAALTESVKCNSLRKVERTSCTTFSGAILLRFPKSHSLYYFSKHYVSFDPNPSLTILYRTLRI